MKYWTLVSRNITRNSLRNALTGAAVALAVALVCLLLTMPDGFNRILNTASRNTRIGVHAKAGVVYPMPVAYLQKVRAMPGVVSVMTYDWFGGTVDGDKGVEFPNFSIDAETLGEVFEDFAFDPKVLEDFRRNRDAVLVGVDTLKKYGWSIGDKITLDSTRYGFPLELRIVGTIDPPGAKGDNPVIGRPVVWFNRQSLQQTLESRGEPDRISLVWARVDDPDRVEPLMREIDAMFRNSEVETRTESEKSFFANFFAMLQGIVSVILIVTGLVALCMVFIAANTASMSVRERMHELAIFKALGFSKRVIFGTLLMEAVLLSTIAGGLGALASLGFTTFLKSAAGWDMTLGPLGSFVIGPWILMQGLFLALFIGMLSGVVPSFGAARRSVIVTLREVF